jgi:hypothetical protein
MILATKLVLEYAAKKIKCVVLSKGEAALTCTALCMMHHMCTLAYNRMLAAVYDI